MINSVLVLLENISKDINKVLSSLTIKLSESETYIIFISFIKTILFNFFILVTYQIFSDSKKGPLIVQLFLCFLIVLFLNITDSSFTKKVRDNTLMLIAKIITYSALILINDFFLHFSDMINLSTNFFTFFLILLLFTFNFIFFNVFSKFYNKPFLLKNFADEILKVGMIATFTFLPFGTLFFLIDVTIQLNLSWIFLVFLIMVWALYIFVIKTRSRKRPNIQNLVFPIVMLLIIFSIGSLILNF